MSTPDPVDIARELRAVVPPGRVLDRAIDRAAFANDASVYRLVPAVVVMPADVAEVRSLFRVSRRLRVPLAFRAAGTSLSGQAITDGILAVLSRGWRGVEVLDGGRRVRVEPGVVGGDVNRRLAAHGAKIGPDPASINACMMGGILANNSSGMCCGVEQNAYHTLQSLRFVLPDGTEVDGGAPNAEARFAAEAPDVAAGLLDLKRRIESDGDLAGRIRAKYRMKNTTGYSLNAFLDFARPVELLSHLMIGSEGTLGFIAEAVLRTVPDHPFRHTGLLFFEDVPRACAAIAPLRDSGARALELMDRASLRAVEQRPEMPEGIAGLPATAAALLVEYQCASKDELDARRRACERLLPGLPLAREPLFTRDPGRQAALWQVRKGLIPSVGAMRRRGTSFIIEDVVFPVERLAQGVGELQALFGEHGYDDAIVFGHAKDGNLHFVLTQSFDDPADVARFDRFLRDLARLVAERHGGALKAEHGTGRNMAPFVLAEWGPAAQAVMRELKDLVDPDGLLNPGVILNDDPEAHLRHLKTLPEVEAEIDRCIECGFCERSCPSRDLTLTPRRRIVVRREMARLRASGEDPAALAELERDWRHDGLDTCAADGLCALACPVDIDTGDLVRRLRAERRSALARHVAGVAARRLAVIERGARLALRVAAPLRTVGRVTRAWGGPLPPAASRVRSRCGRAEAEFVHFPACVSRVLGERDGDGVSSLPGLVQRVTDRAGVRAWIPPDAAGVCCGLAFSSRGLEDAAHSASRRCMAALQRWSDDGRLPVMVDSSPCAWTLRQASRGGAGAPAGVRVLDGIEFAHDVLLNRLEPARTMRRVALHPVCSARKLGLEGKFERVARAYADRVDVPLSAGCCGFAGDRGFRVPELTASATREEAAEILAAERDGHFSSSRTCEIALARATGRPWESFWHLLDRATAPCVRR